METTHITSLILYIKEIELMENKGSEIILFRGQTNDWPLLPSIARENPQINSTEIEKEMLDDLERRSQLLLKWKISSPWELLVLAQHNGLKTRLLDWSSNPLTALWFACQPSNVKGDPCVHIINADRSLIVDLKENESPFKNPLTRIVKPVMNNERILAQNGWFTAHKYSDKAKKFVALEGNKDIKGLVTKIIIPYALKPKLIKQLSRLGTNNRTIFPDIEGLCKHLNWNYLEAKV